MKAIINGETIEFGSSGVTFTPSVSPEGELSWSNDGGLDNPEPVNIKGPTGEPGNTPFIGENGNWWVGETDTGVAASGGNDDSGTIPIGTLHHFLGTAAPDGYLACDGAEYNIADYPALANFFEAQFGSANQFGGDGETTFCIPDLQGRFLFGSSATHELLETGGEETHTLTVNEMPSHRHTIRVNDDTTSRGAKYPWGSNQSSFSNLSSGSTESSGSSQPHNNMPPYFSVLICIKAK